jgi:TPR repeat protein
MPAACSRKNSASSPTPTLTVTPTPVLSLELPRPTRKSAQKSASVVSSTAATEQIKAKAESGDAAAECDLGMHYERGDGVPKDYAEAVKWLRKAADQDYAEAQYQLGNAYCYGYVVETDYDQAFAWYGKAAGRGNIEADAHMGVCYELGYGVRKDDCQAAGWYRKAAELNNALAQKNLGSSLILGRCGTKDVVQGYKWILLAAAQREPAAKDNVARFANQLTSSQLAQARALADAFRAGDLRAPTTLPPLPTPSPAPLIADNGTPKPSRDSGPAPLPTIPTFTPFPTTTSAPASLRDKAEAGDAAAQCQLGLSYSDGVNGLPKSDSEAVRWLTKAAEQNNALAEFNLGVFYGQGWGLRKNWAEACKWYLKAAEQNNQDAEINLANCYLNGQGVRKSSVEAYKWFNKAAQQNGGQNVGVAQGGLGYCYMNAVGVRRNDVQAYKWYTLAASKGDSSAQTNLATLESRMSPSAIAQAQALVREFAPAEGAPAEGATPYVPATVSSDQTEVANKIIALSPELKTPKRDTLNNLLKEYNVLDRNFSTDPKSRVALLPQRLELILALEKAQQWQAMGIAMTHYRLVAGRSLQNRPAWDAEPAIQVSPVGRLDSVEKWLAKVGTAFPKDPEVDLWKAVISEKQARWPQAVAQASSALAKAKAGSNAALPLVTAKAYFYKYHALLFLGKLAEAKIALNQALALDTNNAEFNHAQGILAFAELNKLVWSDIYQETVPLGIYHLFVSGAGKSLAGSLCGFKLTSLTPSPRTVRMTVEIPEVTETVTQSVILLPGKTATFYLTPPLKSNFDPSALRADRPAILVVNITDEATNNSLLSRSLPIKLMPFDSLPWSIKTPQNTHPRREEFIGAWVTPNSPAIEQFLTAAKARVPDRTFSGPFAASLPQVQAMFEELKSTGVTYVMDPSLFSGLDSVAHTRLPKDVLASHNAQCLEGTVLFASLLESIGLEPYIVRVPGHAYIGWEPTKRDYATPGTIYYLETTLVGSSTFYTAMQTAAQNAESHQAEFKVPNSGSFLLKVSDLRKAGITPQPYQ